MALALDDILAIETWQSILQDILDVADDLLLKVTSWQAGQPIRSALVYVSQKISQVQTQNREAIAGGLLDYAAGDWMTLLALSLYRVTRNPALFGSVDNFSYQNNGPDDAVFAAGDLVVAHNVSGATYRNQDDITIAPGTTKTDITIVADVAGADSSAGPDTITELVSVKVGGVVTNPTALLGTDAESDADLATRCRLKLGSLSPNGPKEAYDFVVRTPYFDDGTPCCLTSVPFMRSNVVLDVDNGALSVYCATAVGAPTDDDVAIADAAIDKWATPWLTNATALAAEEVNIPVSYEVWIAASNLTVAQQEAKIVAQLATYFKTTPVGGNRIEPDDDGVMYQDGLIVQISTSLPGVIRARVIAPSDDTTLEPNQVPVLGTVTPIVHVVT